MLRLLTLTPKHSARRCLIDMAMRTHALPFESGSPLNKRFALHPKKEKGKVPHFLRDVSGQWPLLQPITKRHAF
jgi:hypothetical protein